MDRDTFSINYADQLFTLFEEVIVDFLEESEDDEEVTSDEEEVIANNTQSVDGT